MVVVVPKNQAQCQIGDTIEVLFPWEHNLRPDPDKIIDCDHIANKIVNNILIGLGRIKLKEIREKNQNKPLNQ